MSTLALVDTATTTPTAGRSCWRAGASRRRCAAGSRRRASSRSRPRACRSRPATRRICTPLRTELIGPDRQRAAALSAHLARVRLQEAAGGGRGEDLHLRARLPQSRARRPASSRVHHARVVSREEPYERLMEDCAALLRLAAEAAGTTRFVSWRGVTRDPFATPERLTVAEAFARYAGIDLLATLGADGSDRDALAAAAERAGIARRRRRHLGRHLQPRCSTRDRAPARQRPRHPPRPSTRPARRALARPDAAIRASPSASSSTACGVELANAFGELTDPAEQRRRLEAEMDEKERCYGERYPIDEDFIAALAHMPPAAAALWASTAWSCSRPAPRASSRCCGRRCRAAIDACAASSGLWKANRHISRYGQRP